MPLSKAAPRRHIHTREIRCLGFEREDGLWDIEGTMTDTKTYTVDNQDRNGIAAGEPIHAMRIRVTIDADMLIHDIDVATDSGPYGICGTIVAAYQSLKGQRIKAGWRRTVLERLGGIKGCTHHTDMLLGPLAVTAFQTMRKVRVQRAEAEPMARPITLDTCHALASTSPVVKSRWPQFYTGG
ncbi:MAG: DUF2889 domain-containing protein [Rhodospirillales bacterium]|nr:DUF2889 domain-containing protein [Rhodospirillales bacterium]